MDDCEELFNELKSAITTGNARNFVSLVEEKREIFGRLCIESKIKLSNIAIRYVRREIFDYLFPYLTPLHLLEVLKGMEFSRLGLSSYVLHRLIENEIPVNAVYGSKFPGDLVENLDELKFLLESGLDPNLTNLNGENLLNAVVQHIIVPRGDQLMQEEAVAMVLWYGANPFHESTYVDYTSFEIACASHASDFVLEQLFLHTFDEPEFSKRIPFSALVRLADNRFCTTSDVRKRLFQKLLDCPVTDFVAENYTIRYPLTTSLINNIVVMKYGINEPILASLINMTFDWFKQVIILHPETVRNILDDNDCSELFNFDTLFCHNFLEKMEFLIKEDDFFNSVVNICENLDGVKVCTSAISCSVSKDYLTRLILFLIEYGLRCNTDMCHLIYNKYGDCILFRTLLHFAGPGLKFEDEKNYSVMANFITDFSLSVPDFIDSIVQFKSWLPLVGRYDLQTDLGTLNKKKLNNLLDFFVHPKLTNCLLSTENLPKRILKKIHLLPNVPLLKQLARDAFRQHLANRFPVTDTKQLYSLVSRLPISVVYRKIITLETKLYHVTRARGRK